MRAAARRPTAAIRWRPMLWFWLCLFTALTQAFKDVCLKRSLSRLDVGVAVWVFTLAAAAFFWLDVALSPLPVLGPGFFPVLGIGAVLGAVTFALYAVALKKGDLSLTLPMLAFTPLFLLITSPLTLGEFPAPGGLVGLVCVVAGSYVLNLRERRSGIWGPVRALWTSPGARWMLLVAALWSIGANYDKIGVRASSPAFWIASVYTASALALVPLALRGARGCLGRITRAPGLLLVAAAFLEAVGLVCQMHALTMTQVSYVIAVKRVSVIFGVLFGALFFREPDVSHRLPGAALMVLGVCFIAVFG